MLATGPDAGDTGDAVPAPTAVPLGAIPSNIIDQARQARHQSLADRMKSVSEPLIDAPYVNDPMGEGQGRDVDPYTRYDAYDCLTLVEETLALALSGDAVHSADVRTGLRYGTSEPSYSTRNHFMELQWIPEAVDNGWLRETTGDYGQTVIHENEITPELWQKWGRRSLFQLTDDELPMGKMTLAVLPLQTAIDVADTIRPGSIIMSVRENRHWVPLWITHVGFTVPTDGDAAIIRHANRMKSSMRVRDNKLKWYLEHTGTYKNWKAAGIAIYEPVEFGPRLSRLTEEQRAAL